MNVTKLTVSVSPVLVKKGKRTTPQIEQMCGAYRLPEGKNEDDIRFHSLIKKHLHV